MTETTDQLPPEEILKQGYEPPDVNMRGLMIFFAIFLAVAVGLNFGLWGLLKVYLAEPRKVEVSVSAAPEQKRFPAPNLQPIEKHNQMPWEDLRDLMQQKAEVFQQLGWTVKSPDGMSKIPDYVVPTIPDDVVKKLAEERKKQGGGQ
jgi:hypothetical protein